MAAPIIQRPAKYWFADDYAGSTIDPNVGVVHTTEGTSLPWYDGGALAPNYTATPDFAKKRLVWTQHFPDTMSARALKNLPGGVQTNTLNCIQIELVGTCDKATSDKWSAQHIYWPGAPQWALDEVAEFVALKHQQLGIRIEGPEQIGKAWRAYPASYGQKASQRFSFAQWSAFYGWCGHQHVPENDHGDPGSLNWSYIETKAKAIIAGPKPPTTKPPGSKPTPTLPEVLQMELDDVVIAAIPASGGNPAVPAVTVRAVLAADWWLTQNHKVGGKFEQVHANWKADGTKGTLAQQLQRIEDDTDNPAGA